MKQTDNDKMGVLLRDLARREKAAASPDSFGPGSPSVKAARTGDGSPSQHMDADELNSYAENALPEMTRARYTAHLADCTTCRKLVTELTLASGSSTAARRVEKQASASLWEKFSAFFSPQVWRYAVPALALFAVIAVTFIALRRDQEASYVAKNTEVSEPAPPVESKEISGQVSQAASPAPAVLAKQRVESERTAAPTEDKKNKASENEEVAKLEGAANSVSLATARDLPAAKLKDAATQPTYAPEPAAPPPPKEQAKTADARRADEVRQQEQVGERDDVGAARTEDQVRPGAKPDPNATPQSQDSALAKRRAKPLGAAGRGTGVGGVYSADGTEDVRTVGGRRFRRQGQSWIDTAYDPAKAAISVVRGSEQYRALIADEPGIRTIAEQLPGEVVIVWKGRTYRIH